MNAARIFLSSEQGVNVEERLSSVYKVGCLTTLAQESTWGSPVQAKGDHWSPSPASSAGWNAASANGSGSREHLWWCRITLLTSTLFAQWAASTTLHQRHTVRWVALLALGRVTQHCSVSSSRC